MITAMDVFSLTHVQNLAMKECAKEIGYACEALNISAGKLTIDFYHCHLVTIVFITNGLIQWFIDSTIDLIK